VDQMVETELYNLWTLACSEGNDAALKLAALRRHGTILN
jgi:hypothetical protein